MNYKIIKEQERKEFDRFYRANLINGLSGAKPLNLIASISDDNETNVALFNSVTHIGANPALVSFIQRPLTEYSHTIKNIQQNGFYTINQVHESFYKQAHQTSAKYKREESEFNYCELNEEYIQGFKAPFVKESLIKYAVECVKIVSIDENDTKIVIGAIKDIVVHEDLLKESGHLDLVKANTVAGGGLDQYYTIDFLNTLPYAKRI